jgi:hypothetical protein
MQMHQMGESGRRSEDLAACIADRKLKVQEIDMRAVAAEMVDAVVAVLSILLLAHHTLTLHMMELRLEPRVEMLQLLRKVPNVVWIDALRSPRSFL